MVCSKVELLAMCHLYYFTSILNEMQYDDRSIETAGLLGVSSDHIGHFAKYVRWFDELFENIDFGC